MICNYIILRSTETKLLSALEELLHDIKQLINPLRLVFFADIDSNQDYESICEECNRRIRLLNLPFTPIISWVSQPPLGNVSLYCEVTLWKENTPFTIKKRITREEIGCEVLTIASNEIDFTLIHVDSRAHIDQNIFDKGKQCFRSIDKALTQGNHNPAHIIRQWNYLERIVDFDGEKQHYQMFNDSRSEYYNKIKWAYGYPAATGIGMKSGGVVIDLELLESRIIEIKAIDNRLQIAAHCYSEDLLLGSVTSHSLKTKSTPKFERAKLVKTTIGEQLYVSGTAAIRGEESCQVEISKQTDLTMENIYFLQKEALRTSYNEGIYRIYVKNTHDYSNVLESFHNQTKSTSYIIVQADVCRPELLVEIESVF